MSANFFYESVKDLRCRPRGYLYSDWWEHCSHYQRTIHQVRPHGRCVCSFARARCLQKYLLGCQPAGDVAPVEGEDGSESPADATCESNERDDWNVIETEVEAEEAEEGREVKVMRDPGLPRTCHSRTWFREKVWFTCVERRSW